MESTLIDRNEKEKLETELVWLIIQLNYLKSSLSLKECFLNPPLIHGTATERLINLFDFCQLITDVFGAQLTNEMRVLAFCSTQFILGVICNKVALAVLHCVSQ